MDDVLYGQDPPDFIFRTEGRRIGVELTDLVPKRFAAGGYVRRRDFKPWRSSVAGNPKPRHEFEWGEFTLRESLEAFRDQFNRKSTSARRWSGSFDESWLLLHIASGSPFGGLVSVGGETATGRETEVDDYFAKMTHSLFSICQEVNPFHQVIFFSGLVLLAFPPAGANPHSLPVPSPTVLSRGAAASNRFLDWRTLERSIVEHPGSAPEKDQGEAPA